MALITTELAPPPARVRRAGPSTSGFTRLPLFRFDLSRKLKYICWDLTEHWPDADPAFARRILQDNEFINTARSLSWEEITPAYTEPKEG